MINSLRFPVIRENLFVLVPSRKSVVQSVPMGPIKAVGFINHTSINIF